MFADWSRASTDVRTGVYVHVTVAAQGQQTPSPSSATFHRPPSPPPSLARFLCYDNAMFIINWFWDVLAQLGAPHVANLYPGMPHSLCSVQAFCTRTPKSSSSGSTMLARRYVCVVLAV